MSNPKLNTQFDLKNLDAAKLTQAMSAYQISFFKIVLIIGALVIAGMMFNDHRGKIENIRVKISKANAKLDAIKDHDASLQDLDNFKGSLPKKLNESDLIDLISNYARSYHTVITNLSPAESKDMGLYDIISISFDGTCDDFKDMVLFLRKIEKSNFPLRVDSWSGHEVAYGKIDFVIQISAVLIHS